MPADPAFAIEAQAVAQILEELDYFQVLKLAPGATPGEIKAAYHRESRLYHPDRFFGDDDAELRRAVARIYKRINEAYVCLRDDRKRAKYLEDISGPEREKRLRFTEEAEQEEKKAREAETGATPQGRKLFAQGMAELQAGRPSQAAQHFKMALMYEPQNATFRERQDEALRLSGQKK